MKVFETENIIIFESALYRTTTTIVKTNDVVLLVDPNWLPHEITEIQSTVNKIIANRKLVICFTHSDFDHILGLGAFNPDYVIAHEKLFDTRKAKSVIKEIKGFDQNMYIERSYPIAYPSDGIKITQGNQEISFGNTKITFYTVPGHTDDSICIILKSLNLLIAGDYLSNIEFPFIYHDIDEYISSLKKFKSILKKYDINKLIPGHGDSTNSIDKIQLRIEDDLTYLTKIKSNDFFDFELFLKKYSYPKSLIIEHQNNLKQANKNKN